MVKNNWQTRKSNSSVQKRNKPWILYHKSWFNLNCKCISFVPKVLFRTLMIIIILSFYFQLIFLCCLEKCHTITRSATSKEIRSMISCTVSCTLNHVTQCSMVTDDSEFSIYRKVVVFLTKKGKSVEKVYDIS